MASNGNTVGKPRKWGIATSAAFFRLIGMTIEASATSAGIGKRTLNRWVLSSWWPDACREAETRWLSHVTESARRQLVRGIEAGDTAIALKIVERIDPELAPPSLQLEHSGTVAIPITEIEIALPPKEEGNE